MSVIIIIFLLVNIDIRQILISPQSYSLVTLSIKNSFQTVKNQDAKVISFESFMRKDRDDKGALLAVIWTRRIHNFYWKFTAGDTYWKWIGGIFIVQFLWATVPSYWLSMSLHCNSGTSEKVSFLETKLVSLGIQKRFFLEIYSLVTLYECKISKLKKEKIIKTWSSISLLVYFRWVNKLLSPEICRY